MSIKTASANLTQMLAEKILNGEYQEGILLPAENEIAKNQEVSRTTVRTALQALAAKGMISIIPKKGSIVSASEMWNWLDHDILNWLTTIRVNYNYISHLMATRLIFEPNIASLAALNATAKDLACMEEGYEEIKQGVEQEDRALFNQGDIKFHQALLKASHNPFVIALGDALSAAMKLSFQNTMEKEVIESRPAIAEHFNVMEAVRLRQPSVARDRMREIVLNAIRKGNDEEPNYISHIL